MALSIAQTHAVWKIVKPGMRVASFGYPDIIAPMEQIEKILKEEISELSYRADSQAICKRHGLADRPIPDADSFFALLGAKLTVYDIVRERGNEIILDLNEPLKLIEQYDLVLDVGTVEHCFNIAQAMMNMASMVNVGGRIIHENPFNCGNHGFYNLNPTFYCDFYAANGFRVTVCGLVGKDGNAGPVAPGRRFKYTDSEANVFVIAERLCEQPFVFPVQAKYQGLIQMPKAANA